MHKVKSTEQLIYFFNSIKHDASMTETNWHFYRDFTDKIIEEQRLYYCLSQDALHIYLDEGKYYKYYLIADLSKQIICERQDKPLFAYYIHNGYSGSNSPFEKILLNNRFEHKGSLRGYSVDPTNIILKSNALANSALSILQNSGYKLCDPTIEDYRGIITFLGTIREIPYWQIDYRSEIDVGNDIANGCIKCVRDRNDAICAAIYSFPVGEYEYGWVAVSAEHRQGGIMSIVLSNEKMKGMIQRGHTGRGWIDINNKSSITYHENLGYTFNGRYREEYILE